jgi:hypothetical protein
MEHSDGAALLAWSEFVVCNSPTMEAMEHESWSVRFLIGIRKVTIMAS